ncbi:MAG: signal peptidase II [Synergistaceae bacterium]|nr:signal peptidase II [Synergistaceae bacterium]
MKNVLIFLFVLLADQTTKCFAVTNMNWHVNTGISFGLFPNFPMWIFFALVFLMFCLKVVYRIEFDLKWSLFMAGVSGNLIDRIRFRYVVDWIPLPFPFFGSLHVNIADIALITGFICFIFDGLKKSSQEEPDQRYH